MKLIVILIFTLIGSISSQKSALRKMLFNKYDKTKRPVESDDDIIYANVSLTLKKIIELDILKGALASNLILGFEWNDVNLKWTDTQYNIGYINAKLSDVWYPNVQICNSVTGKFSFDENKEVTINRNGDVHLYIDKIFETYCKINVEKYPFDEHVCDISVCFAHQLYVEETVGNFDYDIKLQSESSQWDFDFETSDVENDNIVAVGLILHGKRKVSSATVTKIIPPIMLTFLIISVHLLPPESGEKVSVAITVFLTNIVFLSETEKTLGNNSREASIYLIYLLILTLVSGCSSISAVIVCKLYANQTGANTNSAPEITQESNGKRNRVGVSEISDEQNIKIKAIKPCIKHLLSYKKLDQIILSIIVIFLLLFIIISLSTSS
ncbi:acetylcholine receptor subunit beta-type unc-29-like [Octopus sinensis]|uniref:Acetylcholine receptor subunit beta-type unc-29-like n=1 Tax=Octopus sinensis TaxID=2607531 RepID=A0A6P7T8P0_9MOLL|nr:acetylcholine receptor subunit beta-type unc-29-like [Octopus sinensis]